MKKSLFALLIAGLVCVSGGVKIASAQDVYAYSDISRYRSIDVYVMTETIQDTQWGINTQLKEVNREDGSWSLLNGEYGITFRKMNNGTVWKYSSGAGGWQTVAG